MTKQEDYLNYTVTFLSLVAAVGGILSPKYQGLAFLGGAVGLAASLIWIKIAEYMNRIDANAQNLESLKRQLDYQRDHADLRREIAILKTKMTFLMDKKGTSSILPSIIMIALIFILLYIILLSFGIINPK